MQGVFNRPGISARVYQFHNPSATAHLRTKCEVDNNRYLYDDGGNLAAMLFYLKKRHRDSYDTIENTIRQVAPFFDEWVLEPDKLNPHFIGLSWREKGQSVFRRFDSVNLQDWLSQ